MSDLPAGVTVTETLPGQTVVVNNKRDGIKKYATAAGLAVLAIAIQGVKAMYPKWGPLVDVLIDIGTSMGLFGAGVALTSPYDVRGVVLHHNGAITGNKVGQ